MHLVIVVKSQTLEERRDKNQKIRRQQFGFIEQNDEVRKIRIPLSENQQPYANGSYELDASSFRVGQWGDLEVNPFELKLAAVRPLVSKVG